MKWIDGFFMAWGMFTVIPCPVKKWNEDARHQMLAALPFVGIIVGVIWAVLCYASQRWIVKLLPAAVAAAVAAVTPWIVTGFMHLDGYMDVCDAILSRRCLEERRRILKDPHCGAFAVICMMLLGIFQWSAGFGVVGMPMDTGRLVSIICIPAAVRACAALAVLKLKPMNTSQYAQMKSNRPAVMTAAVMLVLTIVPPILIYHNFGPAAAAAVYWVAAWGAYKDLEGMNGDISGFALTLGELAGLLAVTL